MPNQKSNKTIIILIITAIIACCCFLVVIIATGFIILEQLDKPIIRIPTDTPYTTPTQFSQNDHPIITPNAELTPSPDALDSLSILNQEIVPINNPIDLAERFLMKKDIPDTYPDPDMPYELGDKKTFWASDTDTNENFQVNTILRYIGDHVYFWIEEGVNYSNRDLNNLAISFDEEIYPKNQEFFGTEWLPGVDNDPHLYILYISGIGDSVAGYYSSADELHPDAHIYSNAHEMFFINSDNVDLGDDYIYGTVAHEFQHMIHWYKDRNEETWINEGFSMLSELINDFDPGGFDYLYSVDPDMQLTDWGSDVGQNGNHYGASFLFMAYFMDRFGENATKAFVAHTENGLNSINAVMEELKIINPDTSKPYTSVEVFADWAITNFVLDPYIENGRYSYKSYSPFQAALADDIASCPTNSSENVYQYGVDYIEINCQGQHTITFQGTQEVQLLPVDAFSGEYVFWSNMGDESNMRLTREFNFTDISAPIQLTYKVWYDLETDYDYIYLSATTNGEDWEILNSPSCTSENPSGNSYGCGYNGTSNNWLTESVNLSQFAGQKVMLRFDYVTDAAVNGTGLFLDDIQIDAINYFSDFESDEGGWNGEGFVRLQNYLPQSYKLSLIEVGDETKITHINLTDQNSAEIIISIGDNVDKVILVISGTTPFTREKAIYQYSIR
ncbi:MAG: immune inhibitor A [Anaerolineaceae bacterium]|nr:immune inhibitor A [Anaerolineaceae bacterium]